MGAHLRKSLIPKCGWRGGGGCDKSATATLYNTRNAEINHFCSKHATPALKDFKRQTGEA
jgi:hypothetical protein